MSLPIPARHPDRPQPVPAGISSFAAMLAIGKPDSAQWQRLGERLNAGDEPMDFLVAWMSEAGTKQLRPLFDRALADGIASVPEAPEPLRRFFESIEATPDWVDHEALRLGQRTHTIVAVGPRGFANARRKRFHFRQFFRKIHELLPQ